MQELEDLEDVLADGHLLSFVVQHSEDVLLGLSLLLVVPVGSERDQREPYGRDFFDLHKLLLGGQIETPLLLYRIIDVSADQGLIDLGLSHLIDPRKRKHLIVILENLLIVEMLVHDVGNPIAKVNEIADDE